jgi:GMP synthase (glutamine-hydrolysing)
MIRVLSLVHADSDPPGVFAQVAEEMHHHHEQWRVDQDPKPPSPLDSYDAVAVFGGYMDPVDDDRLDWLRAEKRVLRDLVGRQVPAFGICLGAQLLADAAGAGIHRIEPAEIGWARIELLPEARRDPLFAAARERPTVFEWHSWTFDLPTRAIPLAKSSSCLQAYRLPPATWGVQFHAEVTPDKLGEWLAHATTDPEAERAGVDLVRQRAQSDRWLPASMALGRELSARFLEHVARLGRAGMSLAQESRRPI